MIDQSVLSLCTTKFSKLAFKENYITGLQLKRFIANSNNNNYGPGH